MDPKLIIPIGIPGCGKSTYGEQFLHNHVFVVSTDVIRSDMVEDGELESVSDMSQNDEVFRRYHELIETYLEAGVDIYADATNLRDFARERLYKIADKTNAKVHVIVFTNLSEAIRRNLNRSRVVQPEVMGSMLEQYEKALRALPNEPHASSCVYVESVNL